eukprot:37009-Eustigmatos_ZCMA.PRE.1
MKDARARQVYPGHTATPTHNARKTCDHDIERRIVRERSRWTPETSAHQCVRPERICTKCSVSAMDPCKSG